LITKVEMILLPLLSCRKEVSHVPQQSKNLSISKQVFGGGRAKLAQEPVTGGKCWHHETDMFHVAPMIYCISYKAVGMLLMA
jgi:hypothetical protein